MNLKLKLEIEVDFDIHAQTTEELMWFRNHVLLDSTDENGLVLYSKLVKDEIGKCRVTRIISEDQ